MLVTIARLECCRNTRPSVINCRRDGSSWHFSDPTVLSSDVWFLRSNRRLLLGKETLLAPHLCPTPYAVYVPSRFEVGRSGI